MVALQVRIISIYSAEALDLLDAPFLRGNTYLEVLGWHIKIGQ